MPRLGHQGGVVVIYDGELTARERDPVDLEAVQCLWQHRVQPHGPGRHIGLQTQARRRDPQRRSGCPGQRPARRG